MWFANLLPFPGRRPEAPSRRQPSARRRSKSSLSLETLEDRCVPTANLGSALTLGSAGYDAAFDVATDKTGNVYMTGYFSGNLDFDPANVHAGNFDILTAGGDRDIFVAKYDPTGALVWASQMTGAGAGTLGIGRSLALDKTGNVYVDGYFGGQMTFGSSTFTSTGSRDGFAAKLDGNGIVQWATRWSDGNSTYPYGVAVDSTGNVFTAQENDTPSAGIRKFSPSGTLLWVDQIGSATGTASGFSIVTDSGGNAYLCGQFAGTVDFNPGSAVNSVNGGAASENGFVLKLTSAGAFGWVSTFNGQTSGSTTGSSGCKDITLDSTGNIVVGGYYKGPVDFKPGTGTYQLASTVNSAGFVTKLSSAGAFVWAKQVGSSDGVASLAMDASGSIYVTGMLQGTSAFAGTQTILTSNGSTDIFVAKLDSSGNTAWALSFGGTGLDASNGIAVDGAGNVYVAGFYMSSTVNFNPDPFGVPDYRTNAGLADLFLLKLKQN